MRDPHISSRFVNDGLSALCSRLSVSVDALRGITHATPQQKSNNNQPHQEASYASDHVVPTTQRVDKTASMLSIPSAPGEIKWGTQNTPLISDLNYSFGDSERALPSNASASAQLLRQMDSLSL